MTDSGSNGHVERWVRRCLLAGVSLSGALLVAGLIVLLAGGPAGPAGSPTLTGVLTSALRGESTGLLNLGLLVLMSTPVIRVAVLTVGWYREGDRRFATIALIVLALLVLSVILGTR